MVRGVCGQALPRLSALWAGCRSVSTLAVGAGVRVWGPGAVPSACMPWGGRAPRGWWGPSPGGWPATVVRGVWCQALPLPRSPALWAGRRGPPPTCCGRGRAGVGARHRPLGVHARWELRAAGVVGGRPLRVASSVRRCPSPSRPPSGAVSRGSATRVSRVRSVRAWGPSTGAKACALAGRLCSPWGWRKGVPGGVPSTVARGV